MKLKSDLIATDEDGNEVFMARGDTISDISDAGPMPYSDEWGSKPVAWAVSFRFTPSHKLWTEIVTCDAVRLLRALEGTQE